MKIEYKEILSRYPELAKHHEYCREMFIQSRQYKETWVCMCETLRNYDVYLAGGKIIKSQAKQK